MYPLTLSIFIGSKFNFDIKLLCACVLVVQLCLVLYDPVDCIPPGSSVHGVLQSRVLEWVVIPSSRGSSPPRDQTWVSYIAGKFFTTWVTLLYICVCLYVYSRVIWLFWTSLLAWKNMMRITDIRCVYLNSDSLCLLLRAVGCNTFCFKLSELGLIPAPWHNSFSFPRMESITSLFGSVRMKTRPSCNLNIYLNITSWLNIHAEPIISTF